MQMTHVQSRWWHSAIKAYFVIQVLTGTAIGLWLGAYAWFLSRHLKFTPTEVGILVGPQFILNFFLEIPSGAWADRRSARNVLLFGYAFLAAYSFVYFCIPSSYSPSLKLGLGILAELFYGAGTALFSGSL